MLKKRNAYLRERDIPALENIFNAYRDLESSYNKGFIKEFARKTYETIFRTEWDSFYDVYEAIYFINLFEGDLIFKRESTQNHVGIKPQANLTILFETKIPTVSAKSSFESSLIDEKNVVDFIRLRSSIQNLIPFKTEVEAVGVGCLWLEFSINARKVPSEAQDKLELLKEIEEEVFFFEAGWESLKSRFHLNKNSVSLSLNK